MRVNKEIWESKSEESKTRKHKEQKTEWGAESKQNNEDIDI